MGRTRRRTLGTIAAVALLAAALGSQLAFAQGEEEATGSSDEALLDRLDTLEPTLPQLLPTGVELDGEETWGSLEGDFGGAAATLDTLDDDLRSLFRDADDAQGVVAEAVSNVARGWLDLGEAYGELAEWEANDLAFPMDTTDDDGVATGADEVRGHAERGLRHLLAGQERLLVGYVALREEGASPEADAQARLDARAAAIEQFDEELRPQVHRLLSLSTTMVVVPAERFETDAPGVEARARSMTLTCVDREAYGQLQPGEPTGDVSSADDVADATGLAQERVDCPDLPDGAEAGPMQPATDIDADDTEPDDGDDADDETDGGEDPEADDDSDDDGDDGTAG